MTPEQIEEPITGDTRRVILDAKWKSCVHGGGWWVARDADGIDRLLAPDGFADTLEAEILRLTEANASMAEELARMRRLVPGHIEWLMQQHVERITSLGMNPDDYITPYELAASKLRAALSHTGMTGSKE